MIDLEKEFEGCRLEAYPDPESGGDPWTIGWGHTGPEVHEGLVWTQAQADAQLVKDKERAQEVIDELVSTHLTPDENAAVRDFIFNLGAGSFKGSTLLRMLNTGDMEGAAQQFDRWDHAAGRVVAGLLRRREAETALFEKGMA